MALDLTFATLREANVRRCETDYHSVNGWSPTDWACAAAGEMGEACNLIKKLRRGEHISTAAVAREIADTVIYLDLLSARLGINMGQAVRAKFNRTSRKIESEVLL